ncbi:MAG: glycosyltransferase family 39 protein [Anaerolineales bacterium]|nr:glycosyltransferase family 39 protein [Anaerolineales bacterium]
MENIFEKSKRFYNLNFLWGSIVVLGVILRLRQYFVNRSLWVDEASLALNIVNRTFGELTRTLDYDQGAPIGFLFIEKLLVLIFGNQEYILRFFPLISGIISTYLIYRIASEYFGEFGIFAALLFSISEWMVYYSSELKQYSSDVMIALLLIYFSLSYLKSEKHKQNAIFLGIAGFFAIWISHPSIFILPVIVFLLVTERWIKKDYPQIGWLLGMAMVWLVAFLITYMISLNNLVGNENLQDYWRDNFAPFPPWENLLWYKNIFISLLPQITPSFWSGVIPMLNWAYLREACLVLILIGAIALLIRDKQLATLVIFPLVLAFVASALRKYPITDRFLYFWYPSLFLIMAEGLRGIYIAFKRFNVKLASFIYALLAITILWAPLATAYNHFISPPMGEDIKPVLAYVQDNVQEDDIVYIHYGSLTPFLYYADVYNIRAEEIFVARKSWNFERFVIDVENFRGSGRIWFVFSHVLSCDCEASSREGRIQAHVDVLDKYGIQLDHFEAIRAVTYLYDLNR